MSTNLQVQRHELKYYINRIDYEYCKSVLKHLMKRDSYQQNDVGYFIRSLYLDDTYNNSVQEKLAGIENRDKYRLRIYNFDQEWVKLERKRKHNHYTRKTTAIITKDEALNVIKGNYEDLLNYKHPDTNSLYFDLKQTYFRPVVIVDYIRDAFMLDYNNIRVTFDKHLRNNDQDFNLFSPHIVTEPLQRDEVIIMEIKFNHFLPPWFKNIFKLESVTSSAISKYCQSRMRTREYFFI